jgi:hypothetical protein
LSTRLQPVLLKLDGRKNEMCRTLTTPTSQRPQHPVKSEDYRLEGCMDQTNVKALFLPGRKREVERRLSIHFALGPYLSAVAACKLLLRCHTGVVFPIVPNDIVLLHIRLRHIAVYHGA